RQLRALNTSWPSYKVRPRQTLVETATAGKEKAKETALAATEKTKDLANKAATKQQQQQLV
ncbi:hypothetical protein, partial [Xylella fastidiosa]|uniref:hypothetical protein n=1 Tax=Xylella fastidiosa TaxID=2371 RepID=UPI001EEA8AC2